MNKRILYLQNINEYSAEYAYIIKSILNATRNGELSIVYNDSVRGSGLIVLTLLLELFGFTRNNGTAKMKKVMEFFLMKLLPYVKLEHYRKFLIVMKI